jgi:hypothetical protein
MAGPQARRRAADCPGVTTARTPTDNRDAQIDVDRRSGPLKLLCQGVWTFR